MPSSGPIWCSRRRQRCRLSGLTGNRSCWHWPMPGLPWSSSAPGRRNSRPTTRPGRIPTSWTTWWPSAASRADAVAFVGGSMQDVLRTSRGFVTVSSTAALEAMAMNRPTLIISDFGVSAEMINLVFEESGCLGTLDDLRSGRLCQADPQWLEANYFHPAEENNWLELLNQLLAVRAAGQLAPRPRWRGSLRRRVRRRLRLMIPAALWPHLRRLRRCCQHRVGSRQTSALLLLVSPHTVRNEGDSG